MARAKEIAAEIVVTASTGNAGAALAGMSAAVGQKAIIFAPKSAPQAKVAQLLVFGAKVILVDGTYDDAFDLTIKASNEFGWYCRNTGYNPFTAEGKKTAALEIWEWWQTAHQNWHDEFGEELNHPPLTVFVSVGDGNIISGIHKGFKDVYRLGWMTTRPVHYWRAGGRLCCDLECVPCEHRDDHTRLSYDDRRLDLRGPAAGWGPCCPGCEGNGRDVR